MDLDALLADAENVVAQALAAGADEAEAYVPVASSVEVQMERGKLTGADADRSGGVALRVLKDRRLGFAYCSSVADAPRAADEALVAARHAPQTSFMFPEPAQAPQVADAWDDGVALLAVDDAKASAAALAAAAHEILPDAEVNGGAGLAWNVAALANSRGVALTERQTTASVAASVSLPDVGISCWDSEMHRSLVGDPHGLGRRLADTAASLRDPQDVVRGEADIVLRPGVVHELVAGPAVSAMDGDRIRKGRSIWSEKEGRPVAHRGLTLRDAPLAAEAIAPTAWDGDGRPTQDALRIDAGTFMGPIFDGWDAARHGAVPTGNAVRSGFGAPPTTGTHHVVIEHKTRRSLDELTAGIDHGYVIDAVLGAHTANATTGEFSVTVPNAWRIESGAVVGAVRQFALASDLATVLMAADAASDAPRRFTSATLPHVRIRGVPVSA